MLGVEKWSFGLFRKNTEKEERKRNIPTRQLFHSIYLTLEENIPSFQYLIYSKDLIFKHLISNTRIY